MPGRVICPRHIEAKTHLVKVDQLEELWMKLWSIPCDLKISQRLWAIQEPYIAADGLLALSTAETWEVPPTHVLIAALYLSCRGALHLLRGILAMERSSTRVLAVGTVAHPRQLYGSMACQLIQNFLTHLSNFRVRNTGEMYGQTEELEPRKQGDRARSLIAGRYTVVPNRWDLKVSLLHGRQSHWLDA